MSKAMVMVMVRVMFRAMVRIRLHVRINVNISFRARVGFCIMNPNPILALTLNLPQSLKLPQP